MSRSRVGIARSVQFDPTPAEVRTLAEAHPMVEFGEALDDPLSWNAILGWPSPELADSEVLRWVQIPSVGFDRVQGIGLDPRVVVTNARGVFAQAIAEHALALALAFGRDVPRHVRQTDARVWLKRPGAIELAGSRVLVVGSGEIGRAFARTIAGFGCHTTGVSRTGAAVEEFDVVLNRLPTPEQIAQFALVLLCVPGTPETVGIWDAAAIEAMSPDAIFINVGRGDAVDEGALIAALASGSILGAGLDVVADEPLADDSPLWELGNVILTSHSSGFTPKRQERFLLLVNDNLGRFVEGRPLRNVIDPARGY